MDILVENARSSDHRQTSGFKQLDDQKEKPLPQCQGIYDEATWTKCFGTYIYPNGATYTGEWLNGKRHGKGVYEYTDGKILEGFFENDTFKKSYK
ncbi:MAG: hypothetical protein CMF70_03495 [Magnetovibrio sp.]|nr:hypothetical protein [Magnetovibrio sp.]